MPKPTPAEERRGEREGIGRKQNKNLEMAANKVFPGTDVHKPLPGFIFNVYYFTKISGSLTLSLVFLSGAQGKWWVCD